MPLPASAATARYPFTVEDILNRVNEALNYAEFDYAEGVTDVARGRFGILIALANGQHFSLTVEEL